VFLDQHPPSSIQEGFGPEAVCGASGEIVAKTIMDLTKEGERNPDLLCERALKSLREQYL
jgi:hypothetical protein